MRCVALRASIGVAVLAVALAGASTPAGAATWFGLVTTGELFSSPDQGVTWTPVSALPVRDAVGLQARSSTTTLFLASRSGIVYHSPDAGVSWTAVGAVSAPDLAELLILGNGDLLLLATSGGVYRSTDLGVNWTAISTLTAPDLVSLCQRSDGRVYALARTGGVFESTDLGTSWIPVAALSFANGVKVRAAGANLYALTEAGDIYQSLDAGVTWTPVGTLSQVGMRGLLVDGPTIAVASKEGHVWSSPNGATWTAQGSIQQLELTALASNQPAVVDVGPLGRTTLHMSAPWPNPGTGGQLWFELRVEDRDALVLELVDVGGRVVARRPESTLEAGNHVIAWHPQSIATGLYFVRAKLASGASVTRRWVAVD